MADIGTLVLDIGGAVGSLFAAQGNAAEATSYTSAAQLDEQNAQLSAASTRIQETQTARAVTQSLGTTQADVAGAGFTESGSALDVLKSSAQQGALATSLVNIQGAINENAYAAEAGANLAKAKAANEAQTAGTISAIASIGGALLSSGSSLAKTASNVVSGGKYVYNSLFGPDDPLAASAGVDQSAAVWVDGAGNSVAAGTPGAIQLTPEQASSLAETGALPSSVTQTTGAAGQASAAETESVFQSGNAGGESLSLTDQTITQGSSLDLTSVAANAPAGAVVAGDGTVTLSSGAVLDAGTTFGADGSVLAADGSTIAASVDAIPAGLSVAADGTILDATGAVIDGAASIGADGAVLDAGGAAIADAGGADILGSIGDAILTAAAC
jgi:hypothetical protein